MTKTITKEEFVYDYRTMTNTDMAKKYGVSSTTIGAKAARLNLVKRDVMVGKKLTIV